MNQQKCFGMRFIKSVCPALSIAAPPGRPPYHTARLQQTDDCNPGINARAIVNGVSALAVPTTIDVNTSGINTIHSKPMHKVPTNPAIYTPFYLTVDCLIQHARLGSSKMPASVPYRICASSDILFTEHSIFLPINIALAPTHSIQWCSGAFYFLVSYAIFFPRPPLPEKPHLFPSAD